MRSVLALSLVVVAAMGVPSCDASQAELSETTDRWVSSCVGAQESDPLGTFEGLTEDEAREKNLPGSLRVIGEDGECSDRTDDLRQDRLNVYLVDGRVVWAALF